MAKKPKLPPYGFALSDEDKRLKPLAPTATSLFASTPSYCSDILLEHPIEPIEPVVQHRED